ncbi:MAG: phosphoribosylglycinamide synthetase C domain-containing protein, partial [Coriobacteriia bacterium]|nr:phosphoribosylglycinamide synthetase C domain-containing protein [Coriobacteriia bacterium]
LDGDLAEIMLACAEQRLAEVDLAWKPEWAVSVVIASGGYPGEYKAGKMILGVERAAVIPGVTVYHAGTTLTGDGTLLTAGGRVLNVTALGASFAEARQRAYDAVDCITWESMFFRTDIGAKAQRGRDAWKA